MTRQEALTVLRNTAWLGTDEHREAVEVAIEVLEETSQNLAKPLNADQHVQRVGNVGDVISRADVIATVTKWASGEGGDIIELLESLPSAERTGRWVDAVIPNDNEGLPVIVCDQCNTFYPLQFGDSHNFCPNCGARMIGGSDE